MAFKGAVSAAPYVCAFGIFTAIFVCAVVQLATFTPLYTPVECHQLHSGLDAPAMDSAWINVTGTMEKECKNPNPYSIHVAQRSPGKVFIKDGSELKLVGQSSVPDTDFPAHGEGTGQSAMEIALPMAEATALLAKPLLQVVSEVHIRSVARPHFFGVELAASEDRDEICGFEVRMATQKVGPSRCAGTIEELVIPDVDSEPEVSFMHLNKEHLTEQETKKNVALGSILAISLLGSLASIAVGAWRMIGRGKARDPEISSKALQGSRECNGDVV
mmetsp:Transcript_138623/g.345745  ORF Transcript_138623/g.345745 Transcript_138623/m.345745 type:complete len:274 (+) Transcript_138623:59-880(+)|eukprot:CAMPEP_0115272140 /NCGR_PEP_ID=MMETSP0270-20121206/54467_1 /TAXON_ID=71861 /ORGANISM="Scrippsiella trochoidea, Strain CCMP3099" /LENGTH=273 /DNA_ID=CAMNT_0002688533 /DNA_START=49 /DNA_END=870 /DNA_ORIENTATION=+